MRLPVPGPREVLSLLERSADSVEQLLGAVPRVIALLGEVERLLMRVDVLVDRIEDTRASADDVVRRTDDVVRLSEGLLARTDPLLGRVTPLLDGLEPSLTALRPTLERLAETTDPREVDALVTLVDVLPALSQKLYGDVVPVLESLSTVAADMHELLDVSRELNEMLGKVPGLGRIKRRVNEEQAGELE